MKPRVLIVDDAMVNLRILERLLLKDFDVARATSGQECIALAREFCPDLVLLDIMMPGIDGYETCRRIKESPVGKFTSVMLVSAKASTAERLRGYEVGADDYIVKPFDHDELLAKVRIQFRLRSTVEELWSANEMVRRFNEELETLVRERTAEVVGTRDVAIFALARLAESRDPETGEHLDRMRHYSRLLAEELSVGGPYCGQIGATFIDDIFQSSPLHDIGKVGIPDAVLLKPGRLTPDEFEIMKRHTLIGAESLQSALARNQAGTFLAMAIEVTRHHHERFNGNGYPDGLSGAAIPLSARIVALADVFDALTSARVYKAAYAPEVAREIIEQESGKHFDPILVDAFQRRYTDFLDIHARLGGDARHAEAVETACDTRC